MEQSCNFTVKTKSFVTRTFLNQFRWDLVNINSRLTHQILSWMVEKPPSSGAWSASPDLRGASNGVPNMNLFKSGGYSSYATTLTFGYDQYISSKPVLRAKRLGIHRKWRYTYTNYDVIFIPTMTSQRLPNRLVHNTAWRAILWPLFFSLSFLPPTPLYPSRPSRAFWADTVPFKGSQPRLMPCFRNFRD